MTVAFLAMPLTVTAMETQDSIWQPLDQGTSSAQLSVIVVMAWNWPSLCLPHHQVATPQLPVVVQPPPPPLHQRIVRLLLVHVIWWCLWFLCLLEVRLWARGEAVLLTVVIVCLYCCYMVAIVRHVMTESCIYFFTISMYNN